MGLKNVEDKLIVEIKAALTVGGQLKVRTVDSLPSDWDQDMLRRFAKLAPAVLIAFVGGVVKETGASDSVTIESQWAVIAITAHASGEAARRRGDAQQIGAYEIVETLIPRLHGATIPDEGSLSLGEIQNLWNGDVEKQGLTVYAMRFTMPMTLVYQADIALLNDFITFDGKLDFAPRDMYLNLAGGAGNYASAPDSPAVSVVGDIDIRVLIAMNDWTPAGFAALVSKRSTPTAEYSFRVTAAGALDLFWYEGGVIKGPFVSTAAIGAPDGTAKWLRVTRDNDDGAGHHIITFYTSADGAKWTQLGNQIVTNGIAAPTDSANAVRLGSEVGDINFAIGKLYRAEIRSGIGGAIVAYFDADEATPNTVAFKALATGETWTLNGTAKIANDYLAEDIVTLPQT